MISQLRAIARGLLGRDTRSIQASAVPSLDVPYYAENWGTIQLAGRMLQRGVMVLVIPSCESPLHGMEIQVHRVNSEQASMNVWFAARPPVNSEVFARLVTKDGFSLCPGTGCPLGKRYDFLQQHLTRGSVGCGPSSEFVITQKSLEKFLCRMENAVHLIPDRDARLSTARFLRTTLEGADIAYSDLPQLSSSQLPKLPTESQTIKI